MQRSIHAFQDLLKKKNINTKNKNFEEILYKFDFFYYPDIIQTEKKAKQYKNNSQIIIIDECIQNNVKYFVVCFDYTLIILPNEDQKGSSILCDIFTNFNDCDKYFLQNSDTQSTVFFEEIDNFSKEFRIEEWRIVKNFWNIVVNCLSGFLIKKGYQNSRNRYNKHLNDEFVEYEEKNANNVNISYIDLRNIGAGSCGTVKLIYLISKEEVFAMKIPHADSKNLIEREINNLSDIRYPFIVPYIGFIKYNENQKYLLLGYVEGKTLNKYELENLNDQEKYIIIFELLLTIEYLHSQKYIYRDFILSNIMINQNKDVILIDFDRVRKVDDKEQSNNSDNTEQSNNFDDQVVAPEGNKTYRSDVYSLGYIIHFILYGKAPIINNNKEINENFIFKSCLNKNPDQRPKLNEVMDIFYAFFFDKIKDDKIIYLISLSANQNNPEAQNILGMIYYNGKYMTRDINKAIHYLSLSANQNNPEAQNVLGMIYYNGKYMTRDINKAIYYLSLSANQNNPEAQYNLGMIYYTSFSNKQYIKKGRYYIMLASKNNNRQANFAHGFLLHDGKYVKKDILEAIHYYKEASSFNNQYSKNNLGIIYKHGYDKFKAKIGNAIEYFEEAIQQKNDYLSMYNLAHIYIYNSAINQDFNKSVDLLIKSMNKFIHSFILLCLLLIKEFDFNIEKIKQELQKRKDPDLTESTVDIILYEITLCNLCYKELYESYRYKDYLYNIKCKPILSSELEHVNEKSVPPKYPNAKDISSEFYKGFGEDLYKPDL